jgi:hypothetical protein
MTAEVSALMLLALGLVAAPLGRQNLSAYGPASQSVVARGTNGGQVRLVLHAPRPTHCRRNPARRRRYLPRAGHGRDRLTSAWISESAATNPASAVQVLRKLAKRPT